MNAKTLAHNIQAGLKISTGLSASRSHIYELLASAFGYGSLAALQATAVLCEMPMGFETDVYQANVALRAVKLGYSAAEAESVSAEVVKQVVLANIQPLSLEALLNSQIGDWYQGKYDDLPEDEEGLGLDFSSAQVVSALTESAERGDARAQLALAIVLSENWDDEDPKAGRFWYQQGQKGRILVGVEKEWADRYRERCAADALADANLKSAADLGHPDALVLAADRYGDTRFFDLENPVVRASASFIANIAERLDRPEALDRWLRVAATGGEIDAIARLVEMTFDSNPSECWTWYELGKLHGTDLAKDDYRAIHEDGSDYDDDVGGAMFADGSDGMKLPEVDASVRLLAKERALELYQAAEHSDR